MRSRISIRSGAKFSKQYFQCDHQKLNVASRIIPVNTHKVYNQSVLKTTSDSSSKRAILFREL